MMGFFRSPKVLMCCLLSIVSLMAEEWATAEVYVIAHEQSSLNSLSKSKLKKYFLGRKKKLPNGSMIKVVDQKPGQQVRSVFYEKVIGRSEEQLSSYWAKLIFTGKGQKPEVLGDDQAVMEAVSKSKVTVGYVSQRPKGTGLKVIFSTE